MYPDRMFTKQSAADLDPLSEGKPSVFTNLVGMWEGHFGIISFTDKEALYDTMITSFTKAAGVAHTW